MLVGGRREGVGIGGQECVRGAVRECQECRGGGEELGVGARDRVRQVREGSA